MNIYKELLSALKEVRGGECASRFGICEAILRLLRKRGIYSYEKFDSAMVKMFKDWPKFSGDIDYPVPVPESELGVDIDEQVIYEDVEDLWEGDYGDLRRELLDYMIEQLEIKIINEE